MEKSICYKKSLTRFCYRHLGEHDWSRMQLCAATLSDASTISIKACCISVSVLAPAILASHSGLPTAYAAIRRVLISSYCLCSSLFTISASGLDLRNSQRSAVVEQET